MIEECESASKPEGLARKVLSTLNQYLFWFSCVCLFALVVAVSFEVVARGVFGHPTIWSFDVSCYLMLFIIFLGAPYVLQINRFVRIGFLYAALSRKKRRVLDVIEPCLSSIWIGVLAWESGRLAFRSLKLGWGSGTELGVPVGYIQIFIVIGASLLFLQVLLTIWINLKALIVGSGEAASLEEEVSH